MHEPSKGGSATRGHAFVDEAIETAEWQLAGTRVAVPPKSHLEIVAADFRATAEAHLKEAQRFRQAGNNPQALRSVTRAQTWLEAGARLGLFAMGDRDATSPKARD